jgi:phosphopantetheine--protein transferase-like protein
MIGLDILHLPRIRTILQKKGAFPHRFMQRILHQNESRTLPVDQESLARYLGTRYPLRNLLSDNPRFAAKEAAYKAFQPAQKVQWKDLEVWKHQSGMLRPLQTVISYEHRETIFTIMAGGEESRLSALDKS